MPFETLKIDRSFISNLSSDETAQTIVRTVTSMAHSLGLSVTAEGIDSVDNAMTVTEYGCDVGQGFLFGRPEARGTAGDRTEETDADNETAVPDDPHRKHA